MKAIRDARNDVIRLELKVNLIRESTKKLMRQLHARVNEEISCSDELETARAELHRIELAEMH